MADFYPLIAGLAGVMVMTFFLRRARYFHLPETEMIRAIGSSITRRADNALLPGTIIHTAGGVFFAYVYSFLLSTAPASGDSLMVYVVACTLMGLVHGLVVTLFLVITVSQYHPLEQFKKLEPGDMAAHVISHIAYGLTVGLCLGKLPVMFG